MHIMCIYIYICKPCTAIASSTALMLFFSILSILKVCVKGSYK